MSTSHSRIVLSLSPFKHSPSKKHSILLPKPIYLLCSCQVKESCQILPHLRTVIKIN